MSKRAEPGYETGSNVVHLTRTLLGMTSLCGYYPVDMIGVPDDPLICPDCDNIAREQNYDVSFGIWFRASTCGGGETN